MIEQINSLLATNHPHNSLGNISTNNIELAIQLARSQNMQEECYYLLRFGDMLEYLRSFEHIDIRRFVFYPGEKSEIQTVETHIGKTLKPAVRNFYEQCNGIYLYWIDKRSEVYEQQKNSLWPYYGAVGCININGIYNIYLEDSLKVFAYSQELMGKELDYEEAKANYHSFDHFSDFNEVQAYTGEGFEDDPLLILGNDSQTCYTNARWTDIPSYLELVFHCCGLAISRPHLLNTSNGHQLPKLSLDKAFFEQYPLPDFNQYPPELFYPKTDYWN
mgnify:CR=1 FL=1